MFWIHDQLSVFQALISSTELQNEITVHFIYLRLLKFNVSYYMQFLYIFQKGEIVSYFKELSLSPFILTCVYHEPPATNITTVAWRCCTLYSASNYTYRHSHNFNLLPSKEHPTYIFITAISQYDPSSRKVALRVYVYLTCNAKIARHHLGKKKNV